MTHLYREEEGILENEWYHFANWHPPYDRLVVLYRHGKKNFCLARLQLRYPDDENQDNKPFHWITDYGLCYDTHLDDKWLMINFLLETIIVN